MFLFNVILVSMIKESLTVEAGQQIIAERGEKINLLKAHTAQRIAQIAQKDKLHVFDKLREKVKTAADHISTSPLCEEISKDMSDVASVRREAEALFGKFTEETAADSTTAGNKSSQLSFLVGVQLNVAAQPRMEKQAQAIEVHSEIHEEEPLEL